MRMSGMNSGMDTQSIVEQLVQAKSVKKEKLEKEQKKLGWKQETWKGLNTKLFSLYNKFGDLKMQGTFQGKKASIVNSSIASVTADSNAVNGTQTLAVKQLSKTAYLTGGEITSDSTNVTGSTKLGDLLGNDAFTQQVDGTDIYATNYKVYKDASDTTGKDVILRSDMTLDEAAEAFSEAGLNASFDSNTHRFFISSKTDGAAGQFKITDGDRNNETDVLSADSAGSTNKAYTLLNSLGLTKEAAGDGYIEGKNAKILLNGAEFESNTNNFQINGLNITATKESDYNATTNTYDTTNISVATDVDGMYNTIKDFLKQYNEIINEMDKLYNADSAKGYEPLTSEEKESMSEDEIKDWEQKVKDSLLRRDDNLSSLISILKDSMAASYTTSSGKSYGLTSFGINTLSYFEAADNEKGAYHLDGDADDEKTKGNDDKLRSMLSNNLQDTMDFFNALSKNVYDKLQSAMTRIPDYRSFQTLYDDKMMQTEYDNYTKKIKEQEDYISDYEDKWYDKFAKMEKAMSNVNAKANALGGLFGTG